MTAIVVTSIACFTALLIFGMWKADRTEHRALIRELARQAQPDQLDQIRRSAGLS